MRGKKVVDLDGRQGEKERGEVVKGKKKKRKKRFTYRRKDLKCFVHPTIVVSRWLRSAPNTWV